MHPILFKFAGLTLYTYGFFIALGFFFAALYISHILKKSKSKIISQDELYSLFFYTIIAAIIGARILFVLTNMNDFISSPLDIFKVWQGGLVYYGGFIAAVLFVILYTKKKKIPLLELADIIAPAIPLGHFFGRIGCFSAGCCYGKECSLPWAVIFNNPYTLAPMGIYIHPTQIYEALSNIILFLVLHLLSRRKHAKGAILALYLIGYAIIRFSIEFFRGDYRGAEFLGLSVSQNISTVIFIIGIIILYLVNKNERTKDNI